MIIKIKDLNPGIDFMLRSEGATTIYTALQVNEVSKCKTEVHAIGKLSQRKKTFIKINSVRVITFN